MDFAFTERSLALQDTMERFFRERILPMNRDWRTHMCQSERWPAFLDDLRGEARAIGLWNLGLPALPEDMPGTRLSNLEFAPLAGIMGRLQWAPIVFNCNAPNVPNMEILLRYGTAEQKETWLMPLLEGRRMSAFAMTEPDVASSDARNIRTRIRRDGGDYVLTGRKWFASGGAHPDCTLLLVMGVTDDGGGASGRHSVVLVPRDTPGVRVVRKLPIFGRSESSGAPVELVLEDVRVPASNLLGEEGMGFAVGQARLGPARVHHCMRSLGQCEVLIQLMRDRAMERKAFGRTVAEYANIQDYIALSRIEVEQARLLVYKTAWLLDQGGLDRARSEISMIKVAVARTFSSVADRAVQIFGAMGVTDDAPAAEAYTSARAMRIYDGPDEVHLRTLFRLEQQAQVGDSRFYLHVTPGPEGASSPSGIEDR
ncbi:MAG: acyl-CoA dehydrogenase family protein [Hyphomicrobiaceae bacterium]